MIKFELTEDQEKKLERWQKKLFRKYKYYGKLTFMFTETGIGLHLTVRCDTPIINVDKDPLYEFKEDLIDLSEYDKW